VPRKKRTKEPTPVEKRLAFRPVSDVHIDTLAVCGYTAAPGKHWERVKNWHWRAGSWNVKWDEKSGMYRAQVGSDAAWTDQIYDAPLTDGLHEAAAPHITRIDLCRDVVGLEVCDDLKTLFAGNRRNRFTMHNNDTGDTLEVGSRESALFLRVYDKYHPSKCPDAKRRLIHEWYQYGWSGEPVTRIEFELKKRMVERCLAPVVTPAPGERFDGRHQGWNDALARMRILNAPKGTYKKAANARTHRDWEKLGAPNKVRLQPVPQTPVLEYLVRQAGMSAKRAERLGCNLVDYFSVLTTLAAPHHINASGLADGPQNKPWAKYVEIKGERIALAPVHRPRSRSALDEIELEDL